MARRGAAFLGLLLLGCVLACGGTKPPPPAPAPAVPVGDLQQARSAFRAGNRPVALERYEKILATSPPHELRMEALYHIGMIRLAEDPRVRDIAAVREGLAEVKVRSSYRAEEVEAVLGLLVRLENTRALLAERNVTLEEQEELLRARQAEIEEQDQALRSVTEAIVGVDDEPPLPSETSEESMPMPEAEPEEDL